MWHNGRGHEILGRQVSLHMFSLCLSFTTICIQFNLLLPKISTLYMPIAVVIWLLVTMCWCTDLWSLTNFTALIQLIVPFTQAFLVASPSLSIASDGMKPRDIWHDCLGHNIILAWLTIILWMASALPINPRVPFVLVVCLGKNSWLFFLSMTLVNDRISLVFSFIATCVVWCPIIVLGEQSIFSYSKMITLVTYCFIYMTLIFSNLLSILMSLMITNAL